MSPAKKKAAPSKGAIAEQEVAPTPSKEQRQKEAQGGAARVTHPARGTGRRGRR